MSRAKRLKAVGYGNGRGVQVIGCPKALRHDRGDNGQRVLNAVMQLTDYVELTDDRGLQPAENITPLVRRELVDRWGQRLVDVVDGASAELTTSAVRELHAAAAAPDADIGAVVAAWRSGASS